VEAFGDLIGLIHCALLSPDAPEPPAGGLKPLPDAELSARIKALPNASLVRNAVKRMSLAGAQHKLPVVIENNSLFEPVGAQPSTHILKPDHPDTDYPHSVINEWFSMRLAGALGLDVPDVRHRYVPEPVYLIQRFDRQREAAGWQRFHAIDACQLLNLDRSFKYARGSIDTLAALSNLCRSPALARTRLFNWLVFNLLLGNSDAHLKNLSFLVTPAGIQPAPFYDLLSVAVYDSRAYQKPGWPAATTLAWPILGTNRFAAITRPLLIDAARSLGIQAGHRGATDQPATLPHRGQCRANPRQDRGCSRRHRHAAWRTALLARDYSHRHSGDGHTVGLRARKRSFCTHRSIYRRPCLHHLQTALARIAG